MFLENQEYACGMVFSAVKRLEGCISELVQLSAQGVLFNAVVPGLRLVRLEPRGEGREFGRREFRDRLLEVFHADGLSVLQGLYAKGVRVKNTVQHGVSRV